MVDGGTLPGADAAVSVDSGPAPCAPMANAVPKLLRLSNHEYRNMVSDLLGAPVDEALFARWTPVAEVYGFDTMSGPCRSAGAGGATIDRRGPRQDHPGDAGGDGPLPRGRG
jgi:hypothetical protein